MTGVSAKETEALGVPAYVCSINCLIGPSRGNNIAPLNWPRIGTLRRRGALLS